MAPLRRTPFIGIATIELYLPSTAITTPQRCWKSIAHPCRLRESTALGWGIITRFNMAYAWTVIDPVMRYGPSSNLELMFDRLVCMNGAILIKADSS